MRWHQRRSPASSETKYPLADAVQTPQAKGAVDRAQGVNEIGESPPAFARRTPYFLIASAPPLWGVVSHKGIYSVIRIPGKSAPVLRELLSPYLIPSMMYKLPQSRPKDNGEVKDIV